MIGGGGEQAETVVKTNSMANFKRGKTKRRVRCTLCTPHKWMGNNKGRKPAVLAENRDPQKMRRAIQSEMQ
jgi:hypothetical protein